MRFLEHAKSDLMEWEQELAYLKRRLAIAESRVERDKEEVKLYEYQLALRLEQGRKD